MRKREFGIRSCAVAKVADFSPFWCPNQFHVTHNHSRNQAIIIKTLFVIFSLFLRQNTILLTHEQKNVWRLSGDQYKSLKNNYFTRCRVF